MTETNEEHILVVPTSCFYEIGHFQGFCSDVASYLPHLLTPVKMSFMPRSRAESDPSYKQIVPYVVFRHRDQIFHYQRGGGSTEKRLRTLRSIGIGGHIDQTDGNSGEDVYRAGMQREINEEVILDCAYEEKCIGLINDDQTPVGQVHLGIVHVFDLDKPLLRRREQVIANAGFARFSELQQQKERFESWSQFLLEGDVLTAKPG